MVVVEQQRGGLRHAYHQQFWPACRACCTLVSKSTLLVPTYESSRDFRSAGLTLA